MPEESYSVYTGCLLQSCRVYQELGEVEKGELVFYQADLLYEESYMLIGRSIAKGALALLEAKKGEFEKASLYLMQQRKVPISWVPLMQRDFSPCMNGN